MRKEIKLIGAIAMAIAASACGNGDSSSSNASESRANGTGDTWTPLTVSQVSRTEGKTVASIVVGEGHRVDFVVAPLGGPVGIVEIGPKDAAPVLDAETRATKLPSEVYALLKGSDATVLAALQTAEAQSAGGGQDFAPPPEQERGAESGGSAGQQRGMHPLTATQASWFQTNFCNGSYQQCLLYGTWVGSSYGHQVGRGYFTAGMQGSEATRSRAFAVDYWNGSSWANIVTLQLPPGGVASPSFGNIGTPTCNDGRWYFRSEINDNGDGSGATTDLVDHVYSPGAHEQCYNSGALCNYPSSCNYPAGWYDPRELACANDSCCNPP